MEFVAAHHLLDTGKSFVDLQHLAQSRGDSCFLGRSAAKEVPSQTVGRKGESESQSKCGSERGSI